MAMLAFVLVRIGFGFDAMVFRAAGFGIRAVAWARPMKTN